MAQSIDVEKARKALAECGYTVDAISQINEGSNHYVFDVTLAGGKPAICKFARVRETEEGLSQENKDTLSWRYTFPWKGSISFPYDPSASKCSYTGSVRST